MSAFDDLNRGLVDELGRDVVRCDVGGAPVFRGVFEQKFVQEGNAVYLVEEEQTVLGCVADDVYGIDKGEKLLIENKDYEVIALRPDGVGWLEIVIEATE